MSDDPQLDEVVTKEPAGTWRWQCWHCPKWIGGYGSADDALNSAFAHASNAHPFGVPIAFGVEHHRAAPSLPFEIYTLIDDLTDPDDCWYDHHGYCQAHMWFETDPACPHARAKILLKEGAKPGDGDV